MRRTITLALAAVLVLAAVASAEIVLYQPPDGWAWVYVPIVGDGRDASTAFRADIPHGIDYHFHYSIPAHTTRAEGEHPLLTDYACLQVRTEDLDRVTTAIPDDQVPERDRLIHYTFHQLCFPKSTDAQIRAAFRRVQRAFHLRADRWRQPEYRYLGRLLIAEFRARKMPADIAREIEEECGF